VICVGDYCPAFRFVSKGGLSPTGANQLWFQRVRLASVSFDRRTLRGLIGPPLV